MAQLIKAGANFMGFLLFFVRHPRIQHFFIKLGHARKFAAKERTEGAGRI